MKRKYGAALARESEAERMMRERAKEMRDNRFNYGSKAKISIEATQGSFTLATGGTVYGTDAVATINGQEYTGDGSTFNVHTGTVSLTVELDPTASGVITPFVVSGEGLAFNVGSSPSMTARIGLPNLTRSSLGGIAGRLSSIASGGFIRLPRQHGESICRD